MYYISCPSSVLWMRLAPISFPLRHVCAWSFSMPEHDSTRMSNIALPISAPGNFSGLLDVLEKLCRGEHSQSPWTPDLILQNKVSRLLDHAYLLSICITHRNSIERTGVAVTAYAHIWDILVMNIRRVTGYPIFYDFLSSSRQVPT
jgi:hypothetical protein